MPAKKEQNKLTKDTARKVIEVVDKGLCSGEGVPKPGKMCVEAAVCYALGEPHGDHPSCVGGAVRAFKIALNDAGWSSKMARARGLRRVAVAQLGSDTVDQVKFSSLVSIGVITTILPGVLRRIGLEKEASGCEEARTLDAAKAASNAAKDAAEAASNAASDAASYAAYAASNAAKAASAANAASFAAYAAKAASFAASEASRKKRDIILSQAAEIAVQALIKLKSPGAKWLDVCTEKL